MNRPVIAAAVAAGLAAVAGAPGVARADLRTAIGNDLFGDVTPPIPDDGFTNDVAIAFWRPVGPYLIGGSLFDRWVTEAGGFRRWDQVDLLATAERPWGRYLTVAARFGPTVGGNWGGRWIQNHYHMLINDRTLGHGLQDTYPEGRKLGVIAGGKLRASMGRVAQTYAVVDAQLALGQTGVTYVELATGTQVVGRVRCVEIAGHLEFALARYHVGDDNLALPGGYGVNDWEAAWRVGLHVAWGRVKIEYEYRANEGGSHEAIGVVGVTIREAGHYF